MFRWLRQFLKGTHNLETVLGQTKQVMIEDVLFEIKRISPLDFYTGVDPFITFFATYEDKKQIEAALKDEKFFPVSKIKEHYRAVFLAGVVRPKIVAKDNGTNIHVDELFNDWKMCNDLYAAIHNFTYGQKKKKFRIYRKPAFQN